MYTPEKLCLPFNMVSQVHVYTPSKKLWRGVVLVEIPLNPDLGELAASLVLSSNFYADNSQLYTWGPHRQLHSSGVEWSLVLSLMDAFQPAASIPLRQ